MEILISAVKIFITIVVGNVIFELAKTRDTSGLYALCLNNYGVVNKVFSPEQLKDIEICFKKLSMPYNTVSVLMLVAIGVIISVITFFICKLIFPLSSICFIISAPLVFLPFWIIKYIAGIEQSKLEMGLNDFFIQLKSVLKINTDFIEALRRIQKAVMEPFSEYTLQLLREINAGKLPEKALENFAHKVNIKKFSYYINNVRYCQIYGGDVTTLTEKTQDTLSQAIKQKKKRIKETKSVCMILYMLIIIDIYMYFWFIAGNQYYMNIMMESFVGRSILNINFLSIWGIIWLSSIVRKFDY